MSQHDVDPIDVGWVRGSVTQQIQEQSAKYGIDVGVSGYAALTRLKELDIPSEWVRTSINVVCELNPKVKLDDDLNVGFMPMSAVPKEFHGKPEYEIKKWHNVKTGYTQFKDGDVLFAKITPCFENGKACVIEQFPNGWGTGSTEFYVLRPINQYIHPKLLLALVKTREFLMTGAVNMTGSVGHKRVSREFVENYPLPFPPLTEQQQIAAKLDELLAQVDTLKTRLDTIPKILKRFRQSVLDAATSGKLTEDWRTKRACPMQAHGESGKVIGNSAPIGCVVDSAPLTGWRDVRLADISDVQGGVTKDAKKQLPEDEELPYLRVANVQRGYLNLSEIKTIRVPAGRLAALLLEPGDVLFNEGGDIDKLGRGWVWEGQIERCTFQNHVFRARLYDKTNQSKYISWWGNFRGLSYFLRGGKQTTNLASINKSMLSNLPISLPPPEEQTEIVTRVEQLFTYADQIEQRVKDAQARVNHLTQSILAKAFRGELTADWREQNPDLISGEHSAEALLAKIQAERECASTKKPRTTSA